MASDQPLSYPTWRCVVPYLSISQRLILSERCAALKTLNNQIPLRIRNVQVTERGIDINNDEANYKLGIITIYPGHTPYEVRTVNNGGGMTKDLGRFGGFSEANARIEELEEDIEKQENLIRTQLSYEKTEWTERFLRAFENKIIKLRAEIEDIRENGYISPNSYYLQLISNTQFRRRVERFEYTQSISLARHYLLKKLLPKTMLIQVDTVESNLPHVSLARPPRRLVYRTYETVSQLDGLEAELHFKYDYIYDATHIREFLSKRFTNEKHITVGQSDKKQGDMIMEHIRRLPGAQMSETRGHVIVPTVNQFKITFYFEEGSLNLHAIVQRN